MEGYFLLLLLIFLAVLFAASSVRIITQSRAGIIERLGKFHGVAKTGVNILIPFIDHMRAVIDLREQIADYPQPVITKDNVTMVIDTVVYYQVTDPIKYTYEIAGPGEPA